MAFQIKGISKLLGTIVGGQGSPDGSDWTPGRVVGGRFEVTGSLGRIGRNPAYKARQVSSSLEVAIRLIEVFGGPEGDVPGRFRTEAAVLRRLKCLNTLRVMDFGEDSGHQYLVTEAPVGAVLSKRRRDIGPMDIDTVVDIAYQALDSLEEAHADGVLHLDLRPDHFLLNKNHRDKVLVKVQDIGFARISRAPMWTIAHPEILLGSPAYMSPEQVLGRNVDHRSDLYSLAVIMFELLTGLLPVDGATGYELGLAKTRTRARKLENANPNLDYPAGAGAFFEQALSTSPDNRPADAATFRRLMLQAFDKGGRRPATAERTAVTGQGPAVGAGFTTGRFDARRTTGQQIPVSQAARPGVTGSSSAVSGAGQGAGQGTAGSGSAVSGASASGAAGSGTSGASTSGAGQAAASRTQRFASVPQPAQAAKPAASARPSDAAKSAASGRRSETVQPSDTVKKSEPVNPARPDGSAGSAKSAGSATSPTAAASSDRRRATRTARLVRVDCVYGGTTLQAMATDVSATGAFLSSKWLPVVGDQMTVLFKCAGGPTSSIAVSCEVTRLCEGPGERGEVKGFGVHWHTLVATCDLPTLQSFLKSTLGGAVPPAPPSAASPDCTRWQYTFADGTVVSG